MPWERMAAPHPGLRRIRHGENKAMLESIFIFAVAYVLFAIVTFIFLGKYIHVSVSFIIASLSVVAVFLYIPVLTKNAYWFLLLSYSMLGSNYRDLARRHPGTELYPLSIVSLLLAGSAILAVFIYIPFVSNYAFWFLALGYIVLGLPVIVAALP
jgi:hypothetical protein